jgi:hypothetical protein
VDYRLGKENTAQKEITITIKIKIKRGKERWFCGQSGSLDGLDGGKYLKTQMAQGEQAVEGVFRV